MNYLLLILLQLYSKTGESAEVERYRIAIGFHELIDIRDLLLISDCRIRFPFRDAGNKRRREY